MAKHQKITTILTTLFLLLFAFTGTVSAQSGDEPGKIVIGGTYTLNEGDTLEGDLLILGGSATLKQGSIIKGNIMVAGGTINVSGEVNGDILSFGGLINVKSGAVIDGDLVRFGGVFNVDEGADIQGNIVSNDGVTTDFGFLNDNFDTTNYTPPEFNPFQQAFSAQRAAMEVIGKFLWSIAEGLGMAVLTVIASLFLIKPMNKTSETLFNHPALSLGVGLLTMIAFPLLMVIFLITIILIPVSLIGLIGFAFVILFGWFALSLLLGRRIAELFKTEWSDPLYAGVGSLALSLVTAISTIVPCIGWLLPVLFASAGLGAVFMSRFGTRVYMPQPKTAPPSGQAPTAAPTYEIPPSTPQNTTPNPQADLIPPALLNELAAEDELTPLDLDDFDDEKELGQG